MRRYFSRCSLPIFVSLLATLSAGCGFSAGDARQEVTIPPAATSLTSNLGLGPGARPLSFGPGDKSYPRVSPSGDRVAFVLDGYVVEQPLHTEQESRNRTGKDFGATGAEWLLDGTLAVLSSEGPSAEPTLASIFAVRSDEQSTVGKIAGGVEAVSAIPGGQAIVAAISETSELEGSRLAVLWGPEEYQSVHLGERVRGSVSGLSVSPDRRRILLAVRRDANRFEIQVYRSSEGRAERVVRLPKGMEVLGAPQWTQGGIYFVAGEADETARGDNQALYRVSETSEEPEPLRDIGENFVATSISTSPDGSRLAVVGRRNPGSPTNLYILDLESEVLEAATANQNMEIKTTPRDLAWTQDSSSVIVVARSALAGPEVYDAPAQNLSSAFYNLYEVPVEEVAGS